VKYIISITLLGKDPRFELVYSRLEGLQGKKEDLLKENTVKLYKARGHFPRAWLVKNFKVLDTHTILLRMLTKEFHPDQEVLLEEEPIQLRNAECRMQKAEWKIPTVGRQAKSEIRNPNSFSGLPNKVELLLEKNNELHFRVRAKENALLVLSDTYYPGWKAFVYPVRYDSYNQVNPVRKDGALNPALSERY
jgi:hypothetical protein